MKKLLSLLIPFLLISNTLFGYEYEIKSFQTISEIQKAYPNAKIVYLADNEQGTIVSDVNRTASSSSMEIGISGDVKLDLNSLNNLRDDSGVVIFVVIGLWAITAFVVYAGKYTYDIASGNYDKYSFHTDLKYSLSSFDFAEDGKGYASGVKFTAGAEQNDVMIGVSVEKGTAEAFTAESYFESGYVAVGPVVRKYKDNIYGYIELLGGFTEESVIKSFAIARVGVNEIFKSGFTVGISYGAVFLDLESSSGIKDYSRFNSTTGGQIGYSF